MLGDLDIATAPSLRQTVLALLQDGHRAVALDLTPTGFIDSLGLGVIVAIWKRVRVHGGELAVVCPEPRLRRVFSVVELDTVLPMFDTVDDAMASGPGRTSSVQPHE